MLKGFNDYVLGYPKSFLLNTLNQAQQLIYGEPYSYDPLMTFDDYTAETARRMGGTDVSQFVAQNMTEIYQSPQYKASLARILGVSQDSQVVDWMSGLLAGSGNMVLEGAADPLTYFTGTAATKALKGGSITAKTGTPAYAKALYPGKHTKELPPLAAALEDAKLKGGEKANDIAPPTIADDVERGYTGGVFDLPQGIDRQNFKTASQLIRDTVGDISDDIVVQGSRAAGTARADSDIDFAIRVSQEEFDNLIKQYFKAPTPGSAAERTLLRAIKSGKIQSGEAKLSGLRKMLEKQFGMNVDISVILKGGPFDNGTTIRLP